MASKMNGQLLMVPSPPSCAHLTEFRSRHGPIPFRSLQDCIRVRPLGRASVRRDPDEVPRCCTCGAVTGARLYACVACSAVSCHASPDLSHAAFHSSLMRRGHEIAIDVDRAELFCFACLDQVYDRDFDEAVVLAQTAASQAGPICLPLPGNVMKRRRLDYYHSWKTDPMEELLVGRDSRPLQNVDGASSSLDIPLGLRGLNNLGNTCFMNSVLQALLHTPPLRNYFLGHRHNRFFCQQQKKNNAAKRVGNCGNINLRLCLGCDLDAIYSAVFSGDHTPYSPAKFLYSWWQHAANLASYEQQDAHEFFISILDRIHEKVDKDRCKSPSQGSGECCIAHRVFSGVLRSDVMCLACGFTSTTYDPCIDISLDLEPNHVKPGPNQTRGVSTLLSCLDRFTKPESLGSDQKFFCQHCQARQESLKQMSIRKLPLVSCFHIKRFEHSPIRRMSRKIDRYLQFPFSLDMGPYLSSSILRGRFGNRLFCFEGDDVAGEDSHSLSSEFELFAVITHAGNLDSGHYVTYLRLGGRWYKCDDAWITEVDESMVRAAQGYMMYYVQKMLYCEKPKEKD